tara:strand:- start:419 stop:985 length:567 start_codon:yes stop_codon:yes gene_type:complete
MNEVQDIRKRDAARTREAILVAAQQVFSTRPYGEASLKEITAQAGANPALVSRYFGSKEKLFEESLSEVLDPGLLTGVPREAFGDAVARLFTAEPEGRINPLPMLVFAAADKGTQAIAVRLLREKILKPLEAWIGGADAEARAAQIMAVATGFFTYRLVLPLAPFEGQVSPEVRTWLARSLQMIIDAD